MNIRFILFLLVIAAIVVALVIIERGRSNPWDSDVFFGMQQSTPNLVVQTPKANG